MLETDGLKISLNRGDTGTITITFTGQDVPEDGTKVKIALQKTLDSEEPLWEKILTVASGRVVVPFYSRDSEYSRGEYVWCLRLLYANGDVWTPMKKPQPFIILPVAGDTSGGDDGG